MVDFYRDCRNKFASRLQAAHTDEAQALDDTLQSSGMFSASLALHNRAHMRLFKHQ